jgi:hypothetical protein
MSDDDPRDSNERKPVSAKKQQSEGSAAPAKPTAPSIPAQRWLTSGELETLRNRLKKRFH